MEYLNRRDEPLAELPDTTAQFLAFGGEIVQRVPDDTYCLAGYAWQGRNTGVDVGEVHYYVDGDGLGQGIARGHVRASRGETGRQDAGGGIPLSLATHVYDVLRNDPRTTDEAAGTWEQVPGRLARVPWEPVEVLVNGITVGGRRGSYMRTEILQFDHGDQLVTVIGPAGFIIGPFETITSLPRVSAGPRLALID